MTVLKLFLSLATIAILLTLAPISKGQQPGGTTGVTGVVKDPLGNLYTNSQISFIFFDPGTSGKLPLLNGSTFQQTFTGYGTDSFGNIPAGIYLPDNGLIAGSSGATGTQWIVKVCYSDRVTCFTSNLTINCAGNQPATCTSGVINLTSTLQAVSALIPPQPGQPGGITGSVQCNISNRFQACPDATDLGGNFAITGNLPVTGNFTDITGQNHFFGYNINNIVTVDGIKYTTANAALADPACASLGCTIDMRGNSSSTARALGAFDPNSLHAITVTLLLGPYSYTASQITLRPGFQLIGVSNGIGAGGSPPATVITSTSTTTPMFVLGGSTAIENVGVQGMRLYCGAGNTNQIAFNIVAQVNGGGLWYSNFSNLLIGGDGTHECGGGGIVLDGSAGGSPEAINQFLNLTNVVAFRTSGGAPAFHVIGVGGQITVINSEFDGNATRDTLPDAVIEDSAFSGFTAAYSIAFIETTFQRAGTAIKLRGSTDVSCDNCHFEDVTGILDAAAGQNYGNYGIHIIHSYCATGCGQHSGSTGFLTKTDAGSQVAVDYLSLFGTPDNYWTGTSIAHLEHQGLYNFFGGTLYPAPNSSMRIPVGIDSDSPGYKTASVSVTSVTAGAYKEVDVVWATQFVDGTYTPTCVVYDFTSGTTSPGLRFDRLAGGVSLDPTKLQVVVFNASAGPLNGVVFCTATHN